jgi:hypothetical protein
MSVDLDDIAAAALELDPNACVELAAELENAMPKFTPEELSGPHVRQLDMLRETAIYIVVLCSRRAGKTYGLACLALIRALARPRQNLLYVGLSKPHARKFLWNEVWCPLLDRLDPGKDWHRRTEDEMTTTFANGSIMYVSGTDDVRHIESFLGNRLDLAIVDEAQSQRDDVLVPLTTRILPNALLDDMSNPGKLIMSGTIPEVNAGCFMDTWNGGAYARHNWNRFQNPHLTGQPAALAAYLSANPGLTEASPIVRREWFGEFKFDGSATAYRYDRARNAWVGVPCEWVKRIEPGRMIARRPPPGIDCVSIGVDPGGAADRFAIVALGWNSLRPTDLWHLAEWVTPKGTPVSWDTASAVIDVMASHLPVAYYHYDAGGSSNELALASRVFGRYLLKAAAKADRRGQVEHCATLLGASRFHIIEGSETERDMMLSAWDQSLLPGRYEWSSAHHPDPADATRYAAQPFFAIADVAPVVKTEEQKIDEELASYVASRREQNDLTANNLPGDLQGGYGDL